MSNTAVSRSTIYTGRNVRGRLTIPPHAHPLVRRLFEELNDQRTTLEEVAGRTSLGVDTIRFWATRHTPRIDTFEAALNVVDLELVIRKRRTAWKGNAS
jgi:hypothetical protein